MNQRAAPSALELLQIQGALFCDDRGRIEDWYGVVIAGCPEGQALWLGAGLSDALAAELTAACERAPPPAETGPPPLLEACRHLLESGGVSLPVRSGPSYLIEPEVAFASGARLYRSDVPVPAHLRSANPGNWEPVEWDELLDGRLGPWTMAVEQELVVSIAHTPIPLGPRAAECGVWTRPGFRGRGYAAAVTAAWAEVLRPSGRHLFYCTDTDNRSSQRVAERLGLRLLGARWHLGRALRTPEPDVHPLCSLSRPVSRAGPHL